MTSSSAFTWRHSQPELILCGVRWYRRDAPSDRDMEARILERGLHVDHTRGFCWVACDAPKLDKRGRLHLKATHDSSRVHEWSIWINQAWHFWYRAVDSEGYTWDVLLRETHAVMAAQQFFRTVLGASLW